MNNILSVSNLKKWFPIYGGLLSNKVGFIKAVDGVTFDVVKGETFGLVGESGCGKTTTGRLILRLTEPTEGSIFFEGQDLLALDRSQLRRMRSNIQIIFQDPYASLNPRKTTGSIIGKPLEVHGICKGPALRSRVEELLSIVGLEAKYAGRYPHEFSGGQRQRIGIARALALTPKLIICDEPVSALDVSIRAQILNLLKRLQAQFDLTYIFISHDLSVIRHICDRVGVMYLGKIVEIASREELYKRPLHPYAEALLSAIPTLTPDLNKTRVVLKRDVPNPMNPPSGCSFNPRCWLAEEVCRCRAPELINVGNSHFVACYFRKDH